MLRSIPANLHTLLIKEQASEDSSVTEGSSSSSSPVIHVLLTRERVIYRPHNAQGGWLMDEEVVGGMSWRRLELWVDPL